MSLKYLRVLPSFVPESSIRNTVYKTRPVIQGHKYFEQGLIVNEAPTILRSSLRTIPSLKQSMGLPLWSRDVKQAFFQSDAKLTRRLYVRLPIKLPLPLHQQAE